MSPTPHVIRTSLQSNVITYHAPTALDTTDILDERCNDFFSFRTVGYLGVELDAINWFGLMNDSGERRSWGRGNNVESWG